MGTLQTGVHVLYCKRKLNYIKVAVIPIQIQTCCFKFEFKTKEADFGQYPKGVIYAIKSLETWLHDESPFVNFFYKTTHYENH